MRALLPPLLVGLVLALPGWQWGRQLGAYSAVAGQTNKAETPGSLHPSNDSGVDSTNPIRGDELGAAVKAIGNKGLYDLRQIQFYEQANRLALADFPAAMEVLSKEENPSWRSLLLEVWAEKDLAAARDWFLQQAPETQRKEFNYWSAAWARMDAEGVRKWIGTLSPDESSKLRILGDELLEVLSEQDVAATFELAKKHPKLLSAWQVLNQWAKRDPAMAASHIDEIPEGKDRDSAFNFIGLAWSKQDPSGVLDWIEKIERPKDRETVRYALVRVASRKDPVAAAEMIREYFPAEEQDGQWRAVAAGGVRKDPEALIDWVQQQSDPKLRETMVTEALRQIASRAIGVIDMWPPPDLRMPHVDARKAADLWLSESRSAGKALEYGPEVVATLASEYGLAEAMQFIKSMPDSLSDGMHRAPTSLANIAGWSTVAEMAQTMEAGPRRSQWIQSSIRGWMEGGDYDEAQAVIDRLPAGAERESAVRTMATNLFREDRDASISLLRELPDGASCLANELQQLLESDRREATRWIRSTPLLSDDEKASALAKTGGDR